MTDPKRRLNGQPLVSLGDQIDAVCDDFETALKGSQNPKIEHWLVGWEEPERSKLLFELLLIEVDYRSRRGEAPAPEDYFRRFPESHQVVDEAFRKLTKSEETIVATESEETLVVKSRLGSLRYHDQGGLGVVYVAEDQQLKRDTAVKFIHDSLAGDAESRERFLLEAEITSRLEHPGVVPVYGLGSSLGGRLFYAMRFIKGESFEKAIRRYHEPFEDDRDTRSREIQFHELLSHFVAVCQTIAYAHNRGIVHRDIKPENVMLGRYGETIVIDWGLAMPVGREGVFKEISEQTLMPSSGSQQSGNEGRGAGTPAYMSPEQAEGRTDLGPASDIYSLGVTLYKILAGRIPFSASSLHDIKSKVIRGEFKRPSSVKKGVSKPLEAICLKAMSLDPHQRYPTALELAKDVDRYLADVPVLAYSEPLPRRVARWARRHRTLAQSLVGALMLLTVAGALATAWQTKQAERERKAHVDTEAARLSEYELRKQGLRVSSEFAARTIANQIDIRWRILEREAAKPELQQLLAVINQDLQKEELWQPLQLWIAQRHEELYSGIPSRSWYIQASEGTQVARVPFLDKEGKRSSSIGENFAFRDYFHGGGRDYPVNQPTSPRPLSGPHNSAAMRSTNDGDLVVMLSVPIRASRDAEPLGVIGMSIELGEFADLQVPLPEGQGVLLVESRKYFMLAEDLKSEGERGQGLVLHHEGLAALMKQKPKRLPHVDDGILNHMEEAKHHWLRDAQGLKSFVNLLPTAYRDPLAKDSSSLWLAAFAPVLVTGRPPEQADTGWFVIVQQRP